MTVSDIWRKMVWKSLSSLLFPFLHNPSSSENYYFHLNCPKPFLIKASRLLMLRLEAIASSILYLNRFVKTQNVILISTMSLIICGTIWMTLHFLLICFGRGSICYVTLPIRLPFSCRSNRHKKWTRFWIKGLFNVTREEWRKGGGGGQKIVT